MSPLDLFILINVVCCLCVGMCPIFLLQPFWLKLLGFDPSSRNLDSDLCGVHKSVLWIFPTFMLAERS